MWAISWSVKCSKLCDLRCRYCYEWEHLSDPERISLPNWAKILRAVLRYHEIQSDRFGEPGRTTLHWHGGEPLLLPLEYVESVIRLEKEILGEDALRDRTFVNVVQTNLATLSGEKLDVLAREAFEVGVSLDVVEGQRLSLDGRDVRERVVGNIGRLRDRGLPVYGAVVLAGHTRGRLREIYDFYESRGIRFTVVPLAASPLGTAGADFAVTDEEIVGGLKELFRLVIEREEPVAVQPVQTYFETALLHLTGLERPPYDRRRHGDRLLVVETDGSVHTSADRNTPGRDLGNIFQEPLEALLRSEAYAASLDRDDARRRRHCDGCRYRGACDTHPLFSEPYRELPDRCRTAYDLIAFIESAVRASGFTGKDLKEEAHRAVGSGRTAASAGVSAGE